MSELAELPIEHNSSAEPAIEGIGACIVCAADGVFADPDMLGAPLAEAVDAIFMSNRYLLGLDYPVFIRALFGHGPQLPLDGSGRTMVRLAGAIAPFTPQRRLLYRQVRTGDGVASYQFEAVYETGPDGKERPAQLDIDEFVADMWSKGVRFGLDLDAIRGAIVGRASGRIVVASKLAPVTGDDARVEEVASELRRSDAPRQLANGKMDLLCFENRFPQIKHGRRLLRKVPPTAGVPGIDLLGRPIAPDLPRDLDLADFAGEGTQIEQAPEGEFLVAARDGFLSIDAAHNRIAITDKIVSRDGVSAKTTGNLQLEGDYEEFGEIQEQRILEGGSITVHADVFGHLVSRGGTIRMRRNLVGGSARNADGDIRVDGVASGSTLQAVRGEVIMKRAENCVIAARRVRIEQAINCEIMADVLELGHAEGSAVAGRIVKIGRAAPRRQAEMLVHVLRPDCGTLDQALAEVRARAEQLASEIQACRTRMEAIATSDEVRTYSRLAPRVRSGELVLSAEKLQQFQVLAARAVPALQEVAHLAQQARAQEVERQAALIREQAFAAQRRERLGQASVEILTLDGDVVVCALPYDPDAGSFWDLPPREVKLRLRDTAGTEQLFGGASGTWRWDLASLAKS